MTRSKSGDLHSYDLEIDKTFHRLSRSVVMHDSVVVHDNVVLDNNIVHTEFIVDFVIKTYLFIKAFQNGLKRCVFSKILSEIFSLVIDYQ